jgi:PQQ-dependent catabolism-associated beta-propeller protein
MDHPDRAVALLRVVVGAWFVKAVWTKVSIGVAGGVVPYPTVSPRFLAFQPKRVAEFAAGNPIGWYKDFLETTVLPHAALFATLQTIGEVAVGLGLLFGVMTRLAALVGLFLAVNFGLATQWMSFGQQGFHLLLTTSMIIFLVTGAGRAWGADRWLRRSRAVGWLTSLALVLAATQAHAELRVFVTNERSDDVTAIAADTGTVLKTIAVGKRPRGVTATADGKRVYVANSNSDSLSIIDTATLSVTTTLPAGQDPEGLTFSRDGTQLYVVNENESAVTVIETASGRVVKKIQVGTEPETAVGSPDGRWIAVSNETSNDIHLIDTATQTVMKKIPVPKNPRGMRFTADSRRLFVASEQAHVVTVVRMDSMSIEKSVATGGSRPVDVALSRDGTRAWVSHGESGDVRVLDASTLDVLATIPVGPRAWWTALTPDGSRLYVTVGRAGEVVVIDTAAGKVVGRIAAGKLPWGVAVVDVP